MYRVLGSSLAAMYDIQHNLERLHELKQNVMPMGRHTLALYKLIVAQAVKNSRVVYVTHSHRA
jgi:cell division protein FtsL